MSGAKQTPEALNKQKPARSRGTKKNTKRWCKGKEGREHDYQVQERPNYWGTSSEKGCHPYNWPDTYEWWICKHALVCQKCGRLEDITKEQCPEWPS